jgi:ubiquinone biosynthesis protein
MSQPKSAPSRPGEPPIGSSRVASPVDSGAGDGDSNRDVPVVEARPPVDPRPPAPDAWLVFRRSLQMAAGGGLFLAVLLGEASLGWVRRHPDVWANAFGVALRRAFTMLGATFIKVGQIASTRADLLPRPITRELGRLQDAVPAFSFDRVEARIEADFGAPVHALFSQFDREPVAAASVAQVHRAVRKDGRVVAVKVRRPDIAQKVVLDRSILLFLTVALEKIVPSLRLVSAPEAVATFCDAVEVQLSLRAEAEHNRRFREMFAHDPDVSFPELHPDLCSDAVLTMEFVEGCHERDLDGADMDLARIVDAGMRAVSCMIFEHGFVHADLHPGNLLFLPPGRIVMLDLGLVGEISDADRVTTVRLFYALATGDGHTCARLFYENAPHAACPDYAAYEREVAQVVDEIVGQGLMNLQVTYEIARLFDILRRHRVQARAHMTMVNLALMTAEGLGKRLAPDFNLTQEALPHLQRALATAQREGRIPPRQPSR